MKVQNQQLIELNYEYISLKADKHSYNMTFKVNNLTALPLKNYRIEITMPKRAIESVEQLPNYNAHKSTEDLACFSVKGEQELLADESLELVAIPYFVDKEIYHNLMDDLPAVSVILYIDDRNAASVTKAFTYCRVL